MLQLVATLHGLLLFPACQSAVAVFHLSTPLVLCMSPESSHANLLSPAPQLPMLKLAPSVTLPLSLSLSRSIYSSLSLQLFSLCSLCLCLSVSSLCVSVSLSLCVSRLSGNSDNSERELFMTIYAGRIRAEFGRHVKTAFFASRIWIFAGRIRRK